jgi:hypothetical protein
LTGTAVASASHEKGRGIAARQDGKSKAEPERNIVCIPDYADMATRKKLMATMQQDISQSGAILGFFVRLTANADDGSTTRAAQPMASTGNDLGCMILASE